MLERALGKSWEGTVMAPAGLSDLRYCDAAKGANFSHHIEFAYSFGRYSSNAPEMSKIPMDFRILLVAMRLRCIGYRALLAMAVGEVDGEGCCD
ncbi:hypothetical protein ABTX77_33705 [Streptomyces sp. NPDC097704]|uniref:hypothetical protein n=1 Tax=Streptomyces sp. NPDC097704 TaxID=3157101 RepID=UPI0033349E81